MTPVNKKISADSNPDAVLAHLADVVEQRRLAFQNGTVDPSTSYIAALFTKGDDAILKKLAKRLPKR